VPLPAVLLLPEEPVGEPVLLDMLPLPALPVEFVLLPAEPMSELLLGCTLPLRLLLVPAAPEPEAFVEVFALPALVPVPVRLVLLLVDPLMPALPPEVLGLLAAPTTVAPVLPLRVVLPVTDAPVPFVLPMFTLVLPGEIVEEPSVMSGR